MMGQPITHIRRTEGDDTFVWEVGSNGITRIEEYQENGEYCHIPYIRIWRCDQKVAEMCKHKLDAIFFGNAEGDA